MLKILFRLLSPLLLGLFRRFGPTLTGMDRAEFDRHRRRFVSAMTFAFLGLLLFAGSVLTAVIDAAVQFERHGAVEFNIVMMGAVAALLGSLTSGFIARAQFPRLSDFAGRSRKTRDDRSKRPGPPRRPEYAH